MHSHAKILLVLAALCVFVHPSLFGKEKGGQTKNRVSNVTAVQPYALMNGNNVTSWIHSDGFFNWQVNQSWNGEYPKGSGIGTVFSEGIVFGGIVNDGLYSQSLRVTGDTYFIGMQPGAIQSDGLGNTVGADDANSLGVRAFASRSDMPASLESNPSAWPDLKVDAATFLQKDVASVTASDIQQIAGQYFTDWKEWPAAKGAPWYVDSLQIVRNDAAYDYNNPHHIPGIPKSAKTIWFVCNDQNSAVTTTFAGSPPLGVEEQMTLWSYVTSNQLNNVIFKQVKLIFKGNPGASANARIDSMYVVQWSDPDLGNAFDDYAGCDSTLNLGYAYNAGTVDTKYAGVGLPVPAVGFEFLQGVSHSTGNPGDSAIVNFQWRNGYKFWSDRALSAFCYFGAGSSISDPDANTYSGTLQWYNLMRGDLPRPAYPAGIPFDLSSNYATTHGIATSYVLSGDPITGAGWIDGYDLPTSDRRLVNTHGPFSLNLHDTAEVVIALVNAMGADNLSSVRVLKSSSVYAQAAYNQLLVGKTSPQISYKVSFSSPTTVSFRADANGKDVSAIVVNLRTYNGTLAGSATLADDGLHNDASASDQVFGGSIQISQQQSGLSAEEVVTYHNGTSAIWPHVLDGITIAGPVSVSSFSIASDNLNEDGIPNPGENVRITITLSNNSTVYLQSLSITNQFSMQRIYFGSLNSNTSAGLHYDPNNRATYFDFTIPQSYTDSLFSIPFLISDSLNNFWQDTVRLVVEKLPAQPYLSAVSHTSGLATGNFSILVVDGAAIKNHSYEIQGVDSIDISGHHGITLKDVTTNTILLNKHALPDSLGHTMPVTDGFKILKGTTLDSGASVGMTSWSVPSGTRRFSPVGGFTGLGLEGFSNAGDPFAYDPTGVAGTIGWPKNFAFWGTSLSSPAQVHTVLLKLAAVNYATLWDPLVAPADPNFSLGYRWLRHASTAAQDPTFAPWIIHTGPGTYPYQDFNYSVPFSAWDMDQNPPVRLAVGMYENNVVNGKVEGRYWPPTASATAGLDDNSIAREMCFIFGTPYSTTDDPTYHVDMANNTSLPMMWVMSCSIRNTTDWLAGDQFMIIAAHQPGNGDTWTFNPTVTGIRGFPNAPIEYALFQNYPNPFNPATTIRYQIPTTSRVVIRVYNLLGQEVRTLVNGIQNAGTQSVVWDARNNSGRMVSSGVYFYRTEVSPNSRGAKTFREVRKMLLIK